MDCLPSLPFPDFKQGLLVSFPESLFIEECLLTHSPQMVFNGCLFQCFLGRHTFVNSIVLKANSIITQRTGHTTPALASMPTSGCSSAAVGLFFALARSQWPLLKRLLAAYSKRRDTGER